MERIGHCFKVKDGRADEYRQRHAEIWPELEDELRASGVHSYSIFLAGDTIFSVIDVDDYAAMVATMAASDVAARWEEAFADVVEYPELDESTGWPPPLTHVWSLASVSS